MEALYAVAVLALSVIFGAWLYRLLGQRHAWNEAQKAKANAEFAAKMQAEEAARKAKKEDDFARFRQPSGAAPAISGQAHADASSKARAEALCGRNTFEDRALDSSADLALAELALNSAASILHSDGQTDSSPSDSFVGGGGEFNGAGASASWDSDSSSSSTTDPTTTEIQ